MRAALVFSGVFVTVVGLATLGCATSHVADRAALDELLSTQQAAWNRGDIDAFMQGYAKTDDIIFTSGGKIRRGFTETLEKYRKAYVAKGVMGHLEFEVLEVRWLGADAAILLGRYTLTETPKAGSGLFTLIFERFPEGWKCVHDHTSADRKPKR